MGTLIITVDTEEEGLWAGRYPRDNHSVQNISRIPVLQAMLEHFGVKPTYLVSYPVTQDKEAVVTLRRIVARGDCEIGTHLHPWCNPPFVEEDSVTNTFPCNLPPSLQLAKLANLTSAIAEAFAVTPTSYRAGRFGFNASTVPVLESLGYLVDSSVCPLRRWSPGGPNFITAPAQPYFPDYTDVNHAGASRILEVPLSIGFINPVGQMASRIFPNIMAKILLIQKLRKLPILKVAWLRPAVHTLSQMIALSKVLLKNSTPLLNLMLHSSELLPGASPYNKTEEDVEKFLQKTKAYLHWLVEECGVRAQTLAEFRNSFCAYSS